MRRLVKRIGIGVAAVAVLAGAADYGAYYWRTGRFLQSTDDAYVQADYTTVAPKVSGYVAQVLVEDNQPVKAG
jgi:membrane fusion protein (multidrug efflux system)